MKINIKPENCRYIVNEEQRKVVCIIENTRNLIFNFISLPVFVESMPNKIFNRLLLPNRFIGIATCTPEDEWNVEIGKALAFSRAKYKLDVSFFKRANFFVNEVDRWLGETLQTFNDYGKHLEENEERRREWLSKKIGCNVTFNDKRVIVSTEE